MTDLKNFKKAIEYKNTLNNLKKLEKSSEIEELLEKKVENDEELKINMQEELDILKDAFNEKLLELQDKSILLERSLNDKYKEEINEFIKNFQKTYKVAVSKVELETLQKNLDLFVRNKEYYL